jgi:putative ABC transport system ATP-binding protein
MTPVLQLIGVSRVHGTGPTAVHAMREVNLTVEPGELVAVMGPSGSGKSTLLNVAGGLDAATAGDVIVEGVPMRGQTASGMAALRRRSIGYVFQDLNLIPALTAAENVDQPRELDVIRSKAASDQAHVSLAEVDLTGYADSFPDQMSGGQRQRVAIARALIGPRRLVLADEPTGALDSVTGEAILKLLRARCDAGAAGIVVTHDARMAGWADRIVTLRDGAVVTDGTGVPRSRSTAWTSS